MSEAITLPVAQLRLGPVTIYQNDATAYVNGEWLKMTPSEFRVLELLVRRKGLTVRKTQIFDALYGDDPNGGPEDRIVDVFICKLRKRLKDAGAPGMIGTVWGLGYMARDPKPAEGMAHG